MLCEQLILGGRGNGWVLDSPAFRLQPSSTLTASCCKQRVACAVNEITMLICGVNGSGPGVYENQ